MAASNPAPPLGLGYVVGSTPVSVVEGIASLNAEIARLQDENVQLQTRLDGLEQVGWFVQHPHRHDYPQTPCGVFGEFRFMEQEDGCPVTGTPVYILGGSADA